jgi:hypothetical protein
MRRTATPVLIAAMEDLARTIVSDDGVANAAIAEAAQRIKLQAAEILALHYELGGLVTLLDRMRTAGEIKHLYVESRSGTLVYVESAIDSARHLMDRLK